MPTVVCLSFLSHCLLLPLHSEEFANTQIRAMHVQHVSTSVLHCLPRFESRRTRTCHSRPRRKSSFLESREEELHAGGHESSAM